MPSVQHQAPCHEPGAPRQPTGRRGTDVATTVEVRATTVAG